MTAAIQIEKITREIPHIDDPHQIALKAIYLSKMRERFKAEINRMTSGAMPELLAGRGDAAQLSFLMSYLYGFHWLRQNVSPTYFDEVLSKFRGRHGFLMDLLAGSKDSGEFISGYIDHWLATSDAAPIQRQHLLQLLASQDGDKSKLTQYIESIWQSFKLFTQTHQVSYKGIAREERDRYEDMLGEDDLKRLALVDQLPDVENPPKRFSKLGLIPKMGCPQTCRHCMFIFRPMMKDSEDPGKLYQWVDKLTDSVLFTGGDLTKHLEHFYRSIADMRHVTTFAILLNGDFADDIETTNRILRLMSEAVRKRPKHWPKAHVLLQISFDEFHQEVVVHKKGYFHERIPVAKIANIVELAPKFPEIQLCLLHKQTHLNFSMDVFHKGVFNRLVEELGSRDKVVRLLSSAPSTRVKQNPLDASAKGAVLKDASFILTDYPDNPVLMTSSTIDAYGRASELDAGETVKDRDYLQEVLNNGAPEGESFDIDMMFWFNGWVTLFNAVHMCLGDIYEDGLTRILQRQAKDPLTQALHRLDRQLLGIYAEVRDDLEQILDNATGPHQLFHAITEHADVRLYMTERLLKLK